MPHGCVSVRAGANTEALELCDVPKSVEPAEYARPPKWPALLAASFPALRVLIIRDEGCVLDCTELQLLALACPQLVDLECYPPPEWQHGDRFEPWSETSLSALTGLTRLTLAEVTQEPEPGQFDDLLREVAQLCQLRELVLSFLCARSGGARSRVAWSASLHSCWPHLRALAVVGSTLCSSIAMYPALTRLALDAECFADVLPGLPHLTALLDLSLTLNSPANLVCVTRLAPLFVGLTRLCLVLGDVNTDRKTPEALLQLPQVRDLELHHVMDFPIELTSLSRMETLGVACYLPKFVYRGNAAVWPALRHLTLDCCGVNYRERVLSMVTSLVLDEITAFDLPPCFKKYTQLRRLELSSSDFNGQPYLTAPAMHTLAAMTGLTHLLICACDYQSRSEFDASAQLNLQTLQQLQPALLSCQGPGKCW